MSPHGPLPRELADREAGEALRWIALAELERARACRRALAQGEDLEALHDFRVALRRLRSHLRAFREELSGPAKRSAVRRLRRIAAATNPGRDAEVGLELIARWSAESSGAERRTLAALAEELERRRDAAYETTRAERLAEFDRASGTLERGLRHYEVELGATPADAGRTTYRELFAHRLAAQSEALLARLANAAAERDEEALHRARIAAKRLRYLVEPLLVELVEARPLVDALKGLQDALGSARDLAVLAERLAALGARAERERLLAVAGGAAARPAGGGRAGRLAAARRIAAERERLRRQIERDWLTPRSAKVAALRREVAALAGSLAEPISPPSRLAPAPVS